MIILKYFNFFRKNIRSHHTEFCFMHYAETEIIPLGIKAGYPTNINFEILSNWINNIQDDLLDIINCKLASWFRDLSLSVYNEIEFRKANTPMMIMKRSEELR